MVQHCAVTSPTMQSCAMIQTVELVELPGEDLILRESTLVRGKDLAMDSTLLPTLQSYTTSQPVTDSVPQLEIRTPVTMQFLCDIAPGRKYDIRYHTAQLATPPPGYNSFYGKSKVTHSFLHPHLAMIHFMGEVKASFEREN